MSDRIPLESEHVSQRKLMAWARLNQHIYRDLELMFAVPNAAKRTKFTSGKMLAEGLRKGVPDVFLPCPNKAGKIGLAIEMKRHPNKPTREQEWWLEQLAQRGWETWVCWSFEEAVEKTLSYLTNRKR